MLERCQLELNRPLSMPLSEQDVLCFVAYMQTRHVSEATIGMYLTSLRLAIISCGYACTTLRTPVVNQILKGVKNIRTDPRGLAEKKTRKAITVHHLRLLGHSICNDESLSIYTKGMVWAISLSAFWGSLRMGELLCPGTEVDVKSSCLFSDLEMGESSFKLWIRSPKIASPQGDVVEIFAVKDSPLDPVAAIRHFLALRAPQHGSGRDLPLFVGKDGKPFIKSHFNALLHKLLDPHVQDSRDSLSGHSFRSGLATLMEAAGMSEEDIKAWGRWKSQAYLRYCKEGRSKAVIWTMLHSVLPKVA